MGVVFELVSLLGVQHSETLTWGMLRQGKELKQEILITWQNLQALQQMSVLSISLTHSKWHFLRDLKKKFKNLLKTWQTRMEKISMANMLILFFMFCGGKLEDNLVGIFNLFDA